MNIRLLAAALLLASHPMAQAAAPKRPAAKAAAHIDWVATAGRTATGAIVIGNPAAKVKLVEYLSMTCPHCALLSSQMMAPLQRDYIAKGLVSLEVRHAVRDPADLVASLLVRCEPPAAYLKSIEQLFATQDDWMARASGAFEIPGFDSRSENEKLTMIAVASGFDNVFQRWGMTQKAFNACIANPREQLVLGRMRQSAWEKDRIPGTPYLLINGRGRDDARDWAALEPLIKAALK